MGTYLTVVSPYFPSDLGYALNRAMENAQEDEWICFTDHDALFTTDMWYYQILHAIEKNPQAGLITCVTNRGGVKPQIHDPILSKKEHMPSVGSIVFHSKGNSHDMIHHHRIGKMLFDKHGSDVKDISRGISAGIMICTSKKVWKKTGGFLPGWGGQDTEYHRDVVRLGYKAYQMPGLYLYHWYRQHLFIDDLKPR